MPQFKPKFPRPTPEQIRSARERAGFSQLQAAKISGYGSQPRWAELETGNASMPAWRWRYFLHVAGLEAIPFNQRD